MILKKPYGLLIKYFRVIHFILYGLMIFLAVKSRTYVNFFINYVKNDYSATIFDNMSSIYVGNFIYIGIILVLIILAILYFLLNYKKKPTKMYLWTFMYYMFFLIMTIIAASLLNSLSDGLWRTSSARQYRDIFQMFYYSQFIFLIIMGVRTLGFDIKKFDFKKDIQELEITDIDSELVEVNLNIDTRKTKRTVRRFIREMGYYVKENVFIFLCIIGIGLFYIGHSIFKNYEKLNFNFKEGDVIYNKTFQYKFLDSMITNMDYRGDNLGKDDVYLVVKLNATNNGRDIEKIAYDNFKVYFGKKSYKPVLEYGENFKDYSRPYMGEIIKPGYSKTYHLAYKIDKKYQNKNFVLTLYTGFSYKKYLSKTYKIKLKPDKYLEKNVVLKAKLGDQINFDGTMLGKSNLKINTYAIGNKYDYSYKECEKSGKCNYYKDSIQVDYKNIQNKTLLILDMEYFYDNNSFSYENTKDFDTVLGNLSKLKIVKDKKSYEEKITNITPKNIDNKIIFLVNKNINDADSIEYVLTIRNKEYIVKLK